MKNTKKKIEKGELGYIKNQQKRRVIYTFLSFIPPLLIYLAGLAIYGKRENVFTAFAAVACLPACKFAVGMIMMFMQKPMKEEDYQEIEKHRHGLVCGYEFVVSAYEKQSFFRLCGNLRKYSGGLHRQRKNRYCFCRKTHTGHFKAERILCQCENLQKTGRLYQNDWKLCGNIGKRWKRILNSSWILMNRSLQEIKKLKRVIGAISL